MERDSVSHKIHMGHTKDSECQNDLEKEEQSLKYHKSWFQHMLQNYSN